MPFAVTHVLFAIIIVDLYRDYFAKHKKYFTLHTVFIAGFAGLLPDIDIPLNWFLNLIGGELLHRSITHTPFFGLVFLIPAFILWYYKKLKTAMYFFVTCFGILLHILLDFVFVTDANVGILLFYPFSEFALQIGLLKSMTTIEIMSMFAAMDAIILLLWLWHEEVRHKISDYI